MNVNFKVSFYLSHLSLSHLIPCKALGVKHPFQHLVRCLNSDPLTELNKIMFLNRFLVLCLPFVWKKWHEKMSLCPICHVRILFYFLTILFGLYILYIWHYTTFFIVFEKMTHLIQTRFWFISWDGNVLINSYSKLFSTGQPLPPEMTLAQLLTLLYERKLPQGYRSIDLTVKLGSKVISDPGLSKTDSFKRLRTEKGIQKFKMQRPTCVCVTDCVVIVN